MKTRFQISITRGSPAFTSSPAAQVRGQVNVNFGAGTAGTGVAHLPEIVLLAEPEDMSGIDVGDVLPEGLGFVVCFEDCRVQPALFEPPDLVSAAPTPRQMASFL